MGWNGGAVDDRLEFVRLYESGEYTMGELCELKSISRACGHKWVKRWKVEGLAGLEERSRRPHYSPRRTDQELVDTLVRLKREHPKKGPVMLVDMMVDRDGHRPMAPSTAGEILKRYGLVHPRKRRRHYAIGPGEKPRAVPGPGHTLTTDHKGWFRLGNRRYCYPLTLMDPWSRYVLAIDALRDTSAEQAKPVFERVFREYGVPDQILSDNGSPFCNRRAVGGLTALTKWWIDLGSTPVRIDPGKPQQNGRLERMHRTLKEEATDPPGANFKQQQLEFDRFRYEYNVLRPHRALGGRPPASAHRAYRIPYSDQISAPEYPSSFEVRRVRSSGEVKWDGDRFFLTQVLASEMVGFEQIAETTWDIWYRHIVVASFDSNQRRIVPQSKTGKDE